MPSLFSHPIHLGLCATTQVTLGAGDYAINARGYGTPSM